MSLELQVCEEIPTTQMRQECKEMLRTQAHSATASNEMGIIEESTIDTDTDIR